MILHDDFKEFIESLNSNEVRYLLVGGYAVAVHGHPRNTKDLDIWVEPEPANAGRVLQALHDFGLGSLDLNTEDFTVPSRVVQLGYPPLRIDLITSVAGCNFKECFTRCLRCEVGGVFANVIGLEDLRRNKQAAGRPQDLADVDNLR